MTEADSAKVSNEYLQLTLGKRSAQVSFKRTGTLSLTAMPDAAIQLSG